MKICSLTQSYAETGGGVRTMLHAARDWVRAERPDIEHVLMVPGAKDGVVRDGRLTTHTIASPLVPGSTSYRLLLRSGRVLRLLAEERPDVIELHCAYNLPWTAMLHRRRHGALLAGIFMTDVPVAYVETPLRRRVGAAAARWARVAAERYMRALYARCDVAIAISPVMRERLVELGVAEARCVPLGVDLKTFRPDRRSAALRAELGVGTDGLLLVYAGRLDREKRPDLVLEAYARLPRELNASLVLVGDGPLREALATRGREVGGVHVRQYEADRVRLAELLASADVYVSAMAHETFGLSVVEAQACGLPVVGVRAGAMRDRVVDGTGFLVEPESAEALARRIIETPREQWRCMGQRARAHVEAEFSWKRTFENLHAIYGSLPGPKRRMRR